MGQLKTGQSVPHCYASVSPSLVSLSALSGARCGSELSVLSVELAAALSWYSFVPGGQSVIALWPAVVGPQGRCCALLCRVVAPAEAKGPLHLCLLVPVFHLCQLCLAKH